MTENLRNKKDIYFPSYKGSSEKIFSLLNKTSQIICNWFESSGNNGPFSFDEDFTCHMPSNNGSSPDELFSEIESLLSNSFNPIHPGSLAHLDPPPLIFSILGDLVAASLNNNLLAYELSPSITKLEESLLKWFTKKIGFNEFSGGIIASGGTLSNLNALITARYNAGLNADPNAVFLISEEAHSSFVKFTKVMGLHENNLIKIKADNNGCMDLKFLRKAIDQCLVENKKIFTIVATLGTTIRGAIDPIKDINELCKKHNIWLHIDGSIGGIYSITNIPVKGLNDISFANSITINPQKILGITKTSSLLLVSNIETLEKTFYTGLPYLSSKSNVINRGELGLQGSRPAEVIKLWLGLRFLGIKGIDDILRSSIVRKNYFENNLSSDKFDIYSGPLHIVSFLPKKMNTKESDLWSYSKRDELLKNNNLMLSRPKFKGKYFLRAVMGNYNTTNSDIENLLEVINK